MKTTRPLTQHERDVLLHLLSVPLAEVRQLREQAMRATVTGSHCASIDLWIPSSVARVSRPDGLLPITADVLDTRGQYTGELILWLKDGRLSSLEYAWVTDLPPTELPPIQSIRVTPRG